MTKSDINAGLREKEQKVTKSVINVSYKALLKGLDTLSYPIFLSFSLLRHFLTLSLPPIINDTFNTF